MSFPRYDRFLRQSLSSQVRRTSTAHGTPQNQHLSRGFGLSRRALFDAFAGLQRRAQGADEPPVLAALFCDLDNFKDINDTHGHAVGDAVLRSLAERILGVVRRGDLAARMGGDEFLIVLLDSTDPTDAEAIAQRIRAALAEPVAIPGGRVTVTASIGITTIRPGESADALIARADEAM